MSVGLATKSTETLRRLGHVLGLEFLATRRSAIHHMNVTEVLSVSDTVSVEVSRSTLSDNDVAKLIDDRNAARARRDWAAADAIRKQLADAGVTIEDRPDGTTRIKR